MASSLAGSRDLQLHPGHFWGTSPVSFFSQFGFKPDDSILATVRLDVVGRMASVLLEVDCAGSVVDVVS